MWIETTPARQRKPSRFAATPMASLALMALLAGCNEQPAAQAVGVAAEPSDWRPRAQDLAQSKVRTGLNDPGAGLRGVQSFVQADPKSVAVCGQVNTVRGNAAERYVPFVVMVTDQGNGPGGGQDRYRVDPNVSMTSADATRVYVLGLNHCRPDGGQPAGTRMAAPPLLPPIPQDLPHAGRPPTVAASPELAPTLVSASTAQPRSPASPLAATPAVAAAGAAAGGTATTRSASNLRSSPTGGGGVLRVVPGGTALQVFGTAPGGWYQVGSGQPEGWVHGSMMEVRP